MSYPIFDIEISQRLPTLTISRGDTGIAVLVRRKGKPVAFWMEPLPANASLTPEQLALKISENAKAQVLNESIREELIPGVQWSRFPSLTVAICTKDHPALLARCIDSLLALERDVSGVPISLEILVVDNAPSDDETRELVASLSEVRYICEPRPGLNFARNHAILATTGELLAFMDDDVIVDSGWLKGLMEAWAENPDAAAFTGLVLPYELETEAQIIFEERGGFRRGFDKVRYGPSLLGNPEYPCGAGIFGVGANMAFQKSILEELGGFDEALDTGAALPGGGDLDIFYRVIRAGFPLVYEPQFMVFHQHRREMKALRRQYGRSWGTGFMAFVTKSFHTDPCQRGKLIRLLGWWFVHQLRRLRRRMTGRHPVPIYMILGELCGGIVGLLGGYSRSAKRVEKIRRQFA